jgi:hypothetical protein
MRRSLFSTGSVLALAVGLLAAGTTAQANGLTGSKTIALHSRDGQVMPIGAVSFEPQGEKTSFTVKMDPLKLKDFFLSMREFKCAEGAGEIQCYVPYPYAQPGTISAHDFSWLEHALLFFYKQPSDFGAKLWNGVYYRLKHTDKGFVGEPQAVDMGLIGVPPENLNVPPFSPSERSEMAPGARWFNKITIE